jgi:hypothetical protein
MMPEHATLGAVGHHPRRRGLGEHAAVAGPFGGPEHAQLPLEAEDRAVHVRDAEQHAGVVDEVARREVVGPVDDEVVATDHVQGVLRRQVRLVLDDLHVRVDLEDRRLGRVDLVRADVRGAVDDLPLQVRRVDDVVVDQADGADAGRGEVERQRRPEPAGADEQHLGGLQALLPLDPDVGDDEVAAVAGDLLVGEGLATIDDRADHGGPRGGHGSVMVRSVNAPHGPDLPRQWEPCEPPDGHAPRSTTTSARSSTDGPV